MGKTCFICNKKMGWREDTRSIVDYDTVLVDVRPQGFSKKDIVCVPCYEEDMVKNHHAEIVEWEKKRLPEDEFEKIYKKDPLHKKIMEEYKKKNSEFHSDQTTPQPSSSIATGKQKVNICFACRKVAFTTEHYVKELDNITVELCEKCLSSLNHYQNALPALRKFLKEYSSP